METTTWKVGEIAKKTGITVRTLRHYHEAGLLIPSGITETGYRIYSKNDIIRLHQIMCLKNLGFNLEKIKIILEQKDYDPKNLLRTQIIAIENQVKLQEKTKLHLESILLNLIVNKESSVNDFIEIIGVYKMNTTMLFSKGEMEEMISKARHIPFELKEETAKTTRAFVENLRYCFNNKLSSDDPKVKEIVNQWGKMADGLKNAVNLPESVKEKVNAVMKFDINQVGMSNELFEYLKNIIKDNRLV
ncbi:MAG: MerR family transcriptional regulator [Treponema sp.]|jgi:DNA-binding transcriptional MerR regulator|nr:MerR family transcriptional regulator [Treponema sp.]